MFREQFFSGEIPMPLTTAGLLLIDRSLPFDPKVLGSDWSVEEEDLRMLEISEIDVHHIVQLNAVEDGEHLIGGQEWLERDRVGDTPCLDDSCHQAFWDNQSLIPETCKEPVDGFVRYAMFGGTVLCHPVFGRGVLYILWRQTEWRSGIAWLKNPFGRGSVALLLGASEL